MRRYLFLSTLLILAGLAACSDDGTASPAPPGLTSGPGTSSGGDPVKPAPTGTTPPATTPPSEPEWVAPVVATTSAGCGTPQAQAIHADYTTPAGRTYHVWGPSGYNPNKTYPVVMTYHGLQTNGSDFESWFKMEDYTNNEAFVVYPDAVGANAYWDVDGESDLAFFDEMVKQLGATYCINPSRILGFGFSYGGHFVDHLGCKRAGYVKAITVGDGGPGGDRVRCGRLPVLVTTRTNDTNEYPAYGVNVATRWTATNKCGADGPKLPQLNADQGNENMGYCMVKNPCSNPGGLTFCEDTSTFPAGSPTDWNHTVREYYRAFAFNWFKALP